MSGINTLMLFMAITIGVFLICRELICWYWKVNRMVELSELRLSETKRTNERLDALFELLQKKSYSPVQE